MSQQHKQYGADLPPGEFRITSQSSKVVQTEVIMPERNHADVMQTGIIIHDMTRNHLINTGVIVHDVDSQRDSEADRGNQPNQPKILSWFGAFWCWFVDRFAFSSELQVRQRHDRDGNLWWDIYDPITKRSAQFSSESEVRVWIEQSYQHQFR